MSDLKTYLLAAWKYADRREKWDQVDKNVWTHAFLVLKTHVNRLPFGAICNEETIGPLKHLVATMSEDLKHMASDHGSGGDVSASVWGEHFPRNMSNECRQYMCLILFYILAWAATEAPFKGRGILDTISSLENLLLDCWAVGPLSWKRSRSASHRGIEVVPPTHNPKLLWNLFVRYHSHIHVKVVPVEPEGSSQPDVVSLGISLEQVELGDPTYDETDVGERLRHVQCYFR